MVQLSVSQGLTTAKPLEWKQIFKVFQKPAYFMELFAEHIYHDAELNGKQSVKNKQYSCKLLFQVIYNYTCSYSLLCPSSALLSEATIF